MNVKIKFHVLPKQMSNSEAEMTKNPIKDEHISILAVYPLSCVYEQQQNLGRGMRAGKSGLSSPEVMSCDGGRCVNAYGFGKRKFYQILLFSRKSFLEFSILL